ncbi:PapG chaperone-binding domain-containing protein [Escherichia coli]|uniref:PapG chaperone-binding domain-containing protein n=2 Tax=Escherichia TaxID=561 RepID=UPI00092D6CB3
MFWGADNELQEDEVNFFRIRKNGELSTNTAEGHSVSRNVTITCDEPASLKVSVSSRSTPRTLYSNGVGVGLGNGWDSVLQIGDSGLSDYSLTDKTVSVLGGSTSMPITSTLKKNTAASVGNISGSMVISLGMDYSDSYSPQMLG